MTIEFSVCVYPIHGRELVEEHALLGITEKEILDLIDLQPVQLIGREPAAPIRVMKYLSQKFGFDYKPDIYEYYIASYESK